MNADTHREAILKTLHFRPYFTTELFLHLQSQGLSIGAKSLTNRLSDLQREGHIQGNTIDGHREKRWEKVQTTTEGQGVFPL